MNVFTNEIYSIKMQNLSSHRSLVMVLLNLIVFFLCTASNVFASTKDPLNDWINVVKLGGDFSVFSFGLSPYNRSVPFLTLNERQAFSEGAEAFNRDLIAFLINKNYKYLSNANASSCESCHFRDGKGNSLSPKIELTGFSVVNELDPITSLFYRKPIKKDARTIHLKEISWKVIDVVKFSDEEVVELVQPLAMLNGKEVLVDLRNGPGVYGLGLIEAISDSDIVQNANNQSFENFGVRGLIPYNASTNGRVGRFGTKARFATVSSQVRNALSSELGIYEPKKVNVSNEDQIMYEKLIEDISNYLRLLAVPARRIKSETRLDIQNGARLFSEIGCVMCHKPAWNTADSIDTPNMFREQTIYPFSDFLLHDLGAGLSSPAKSALASYWRTAPLWGIGLQRSVSSSAGFLHDGRARNFTEAIMWHGGEALYSANNFRNLNKQERNSVLQFLSSL